MSRMGNSPFRVASARQAASTPYAVGASSGSPMTTETPGNDIVFTGGIDLRIRSSSNTQHVLAAYDDTTLILKNVRHFERLISQMAHNADFAAATTVEPVIEFHAQDNSGATPANYTPYRRTSPQRGSRGYNSMTDAPKCVAKYKFSDIKHVTHGNTKRGIVMEIRDAGRTALNLLPHSQNGTGAGTVGQGLFSVQVAFSTAESRGVVYNAIIAALKHHKQVSQLRAAQQASGGRQGAVEAIGDVLKSVRSMQDRTHKLLDDLRKEDQNIYDPVTGELNALDGAGGGEQRSLHMWAQRALQRRTNIHDANDRVEEIQMRRAQRQKQLERLGVNTTTNGSSNSGGYPNLNTTSQLSSSTMLNSSTASMGGSGSLGGSLRSPRGRAAENSGRFSPNAFLSLSPPSSPTKRVAIDERAILQKQQQVVSPIRRVAAERGEDEAAVAGVAQRGNHARHASPIRRKSSTSRRSSTGGGAESSTSGTDYNKKVTCPHCHRQCPASHPPNCAHRKTKCPYCSAIVTARDAKEHRLLCKQRMANRASGGGVSDSTAGGGSNRYTVPVDSP